MDGVKLRSVDDSSQSILMLAKDGMIRVECKYNPFAKYSEIDA
jgi:hypothetical protein